MSKKEKFALKATGLTAVILVVLGIVVTGAVSLKHDGFYCFRHEKAVAIEDRAEFFDKQVERLMSRPLQYHQMLGMTEQEFRGYLAPLKGEIYDGYENFFIVIPVNAIPLQKKLTALSAWYRLDPEYYIKNIPESADDQNRTAPYLISDVKKCCLDLNLSPNEAVQMATYFPEITLDDGIRGLGWTLKHNQLGPLFAVR